MPANEDQQTSKDVLIKYKEEQQKRLASFIAGKRDHNGYEIVSILSRSDNWVIYEIKTTNIVESLRVNIDTVIEDDPQKIIEKFHQIRASFIKFKNMLYMVNDYASYRASAAQIISHGLSGFPDEANLQFDELIKEISENYIRQFHNRLVYMVTALGFTIINISVSLLAYSTHYFRDLKQIETLIYVGTGASIGGFISINRKLKQMVFEKGVQSRWFVLYALERVFISIFAGIVVYYAIKSNLIFGQVAKLSPPTPGYILFAAVAGFSETLIPNLLIKLEEKQK